jgi:tetratricopeptide (TPR) repeat protein
MSLILAILAQIGPFATTPPPAPLRPPAQSRHEVREKAAPEAESQPETVPHSRLQACLDDATANAPDAVDQAEDWLEKTQGPARAEPEQCLGAAHVARGEWSEAEAAFLAGRDAAAESDHLLRAQLGGMAGDAALANGAPERALAALDTAHADATATGNVKLAGELALDRARALVALKRNEDAAKALAEARTSSPDNPLAWLLSATLSRRMGKLADAQAQITTAAQLDPRDPEIGLEAGLIAVLSGHDDAARKSWQSVVAMAPDSQAGATARGYIAQLDAATAAKPAGSPKP